MKESTTSAPCFTTILYNIRQVVFLVETAQIIAVLFVNYKGRPWMKGVCSREDLPQSSCCWCLNCDPFRLHFKVTENHALFLSVFFCVIGVAICAWGVFPQVGHDLTNPQLVFIQP